jgi:hypothetical protein
MAMPSAVPQVDLVSLGEERARPLGTTAETGVSVALLGSTGPGVRWVVSSADTAPAGLEISLTCVVGIIVGDRTGVCGASLAAIISMEDVAPPRC